MEQPRPPNFEQYIKMVGYWHKMNRPQKEWVKAVSSGNKRFNGFVGSGGTRYGWGTIHSYWRQYQEKVKKYEEGMVSTRNVQSSGQRNGPSSEASC